MLIKISGGFIDRLRGRRTTSGVVGSWLVKETFPHSSCITLTLLLLQIPRKPYHLHACGQVEDLWVGFKALDLVPEMGLDCWVI